MRNFIKYTDNNKLGFLGLSTQNKLIIFGSFLSSILIICTAWLIIDNTQKTITNSYHNFGLMLAKTISVEASDMITDVSSQKKNNKLKRLSNVIVKRNDDIAYVIFRDESGNIIYSSKNNNNLLSSENELNIIEVSHPMISEYSGMKRVIGSIVLGLTGNTMRIVGKATRNLMIVIFTVAWLLSIAAVFINTFLITRQLKLLLDGVKRVSTGEFGYKITSKELWGEVKQLFNSFNTMSTKLRQYEEKNIDKLTYERNKLEAVLMSIANGVIVCDNYDKVILVNTSALGMLEIKSNELVHSNILNFCDSNGKLCFQEDIAKFKDTPLEEIECQPLECELIIDAKVLKVFISPIFDYHQDYLGYILILHDITKEAEIDKMKNTFISNVSHELRTPVTVLRSYIDTLYNCGEDLDKQTKDEFIEVMNEESDRLNRLVNDILDFSRLESANVELEKTSCNIGPIVDLTVKSMNVLAQEKNLSFSVLIEPDLPKITINAESIERAIKNLVSNAIKYSYEGGRVKITAELDRTGNYLQVSVEDNGMGIAEDHLDKIFDRFYRVENKTHTIKGTGLGLHIVKVTIEKHHCGEVFVESTIDEGSVFGFRLPLVDQKQGLELEV